METPKKEFFNSSHIRSTASPLRGQKYLPKISFLA